MMRHIEDLHQGPSYQSSKTKLAALLHSAKLTQVKMAMSPTSQTSPGYHSVRLHFWYILIQTDI